MLAPRKDYIYYGETNHLSNETTINERGENEGQGFQTSRMSGMQSGVLVVTLSHKFQTQDASTEANLSP